MSGESTSPERLRPAWRPFVGRPTFWAAIPAVLVAAGSFFFWELLEPVLGQWAVVAPGMAAIFVLLVFVERCIRYGKTRYEVRPDRIVVETGTFFVERSVELDIENITLVEWDSPVVLRHLYDVGHVTVQEAGSAEKPAFLGYVERPGRLYERIGERMEARGFSMGRQRRIQEQAPGVLGAAVDLVVSQARALWVAGLFLLTVSPDLVALVIGEGPNLVRLLAGEYEVFAEHLTQGGFWRARIGAGLIVVSLIGLVGGWLTMRFVDLVHRTYTLYDDVIDYVDGFLNETHKYIPLENLADTQLSRPIYKRLLGLSDVTLSSQGAENAIEFQSTPDGRSFSEAIEELVHRERGEVGASRERAAGEESSAEREVQTPERSAGRAEPAADLQLRPTYRRALLRGIGLGVWLVFILMLFSMDVIIGLFEQNGLPGGLAAGGVVGIVVIGGLLWVAASIAGAVWWSGRAWATGFRFDERGARKIFDLLSQNETQFALERITSVSVYRNPLDWMVGTMTLRFRSIGSEEDIDFWGIDHDPSTVEAVRARLGLGDEPEGRLAGELTPEYTVWDGLAVRGPLYALGVLGIAVGSVILAAVGFPLGTMGPVLLVLGGVGLALLDQTLRGLVHGRMRGAVRGEHLEVAGGVVRDFRHMAPLEHVKVVDSLRYPGSSLGGVTFRTAGFPVGVGHVPEVAGVHERIDQRLADGEFARRPEPGGEDAVTTFEPSAFTEAMRRALWLVVGVGIAVVPYVFVYYRYVDYTVEQARIVADSGLYFDRRVTVLFGRIDHIESSRGFTHHLTDTRDTEVYTVGSSACDVRLRSVGRSTGAIELVRERLSFDGKDGVSV